MPNAVGNFFMKMIVLSPLHPLLGRSFGVITVSGKKTGRQFSLPIHILAQPDGSLLVVSLRSRSWWRNRRAGEQAKLHASGKDLTVVAKVFETQEQVATGLETYFRQYPQYAKYFHIPLDPDGRPNPARLREVAGERVLIRLLPAE